MAKKNLLERHEMIAIQDSITGQMVGAKVSVIVKKDTPKYNEKFTMLFQAVNLTMIRNMKPVTSKLLLYLCASCEYGNLITQGMDEISTYLQYTRRNIELAMKELEGLNIIIKHKNPNDKRMNFVYLNPLQSWKGNYQERGKLIETFKDANQLELFNEKGKTILPNSNFLDQE